MKNLGDYFGELVGREGATRKDLTARWHRKDVRSITQCLRNAFVRCRFTRRPLLVERNVSGPAMGNRVADFFAARMDEQLRNFQIKKCAGQGYPDRQLVRLQKDRRFALELKSTRTFEPKSTHRVILTCSSHKLQRHFGGPVHHLLVTIFYRKQGREIWINNFRLDFLEPSTKVNVRLEASLSHHLLANSTHPSFWGHAVLAA